MSGIKQLLVIMLLVILLPGVAACSGIGMETGTTTTISDEGANFRFLISDDVNAINDFSSVYVTISKIGVQQEGESGTWEEFTPDISEVDLKPLQDENAMEIWSGNLLPGTYSKIFIYVTEVNGTLIPELGGEQANVKLPSNKLQISKPFTINENEPAFFVYDITVVKAGQSGQYILQPQIAQSGADQEFTEVKPEKNSEDKKDKAITFEGSIESINGTTWTVTIGEESRTVDVSEAEIEGEPATGFLVEIKGTEQDGIIMADEVKVSEPEYQAITEENSRIIAEEFVRNSPTYEFDGIEDSLTLVETLYPAHETKWQFVFTFQSRHAGYGDRSDEIVAEVISDHEAIITVENGEVSTAIMDEAWDMIDQEFVE